MKESSKDSHEARTINSILQLGNRSRKVLGFTQSHRERWYQSPIRFSQSWPSRLFLQLDFLRGQKVLTYKTLRNVWEYQ